jgi:hypothetical protein
MQKESGDQWVSPVEDVEAQRCKGKNSPICVHLCSSVVEVIIRTWYTSVLIRHACNILPDPIVYADNENLFLSKERTIMQTDYPQQPDSPHASGQAQQSSAGIKTYRLPLEPEPAMQTPPTAQPAAAQAPHTPPTPRTSKRNNALALFLIGLGVLLLLGRIPAGGDVQGGLVMLTIASCFLFFSFWKHIYGLLIPGGILAGLSLGITFASLTSGASVMWGLALGFLSILFIGRMLFNKQSQWPVYVAVPLFALGIIVAAANLPGFFFGWLVWLPLLLIGAGIYLGWVKKN